MYIVLLIYCNILQNITLQIYILSQLQQLMAVTVQIFYFKRHFLWRIPHGS